MLPEGIIVGALWLEHGHCGKHPHTSLTSGVLMGLCERLHVGLYPGELLAFSMSLAQLGFINIKELCLTASECDIILLRKV